MDALHPLDAAVIAAYGLVVVAIGVVANRRQKTTEDYFLGGRRLAWWAVGVSLIATSFSSSALIGGTGIGYARGMGYLQLQLGDLLAIGIACVLFMPYFARLRLTSAYEVLEDRFGPAARTAGSLLFIGQTLARAAILVYGPALAIHAVLGWSIETAIWVTAGAAIVYSAFGGIAAVVWTDLIQLCVVVVAVGTSVALVASDVPGGLGAVVEHASAAGRLDAVSFEVDVSSPFNLSGALLAYGTLALSVAGTNQQAVQRYMACTDLAASRRAALLGWTIGAFAVAATLFLGVCLSALTELVPGSLTVPEKPDKVLPLFVLERLPVGLAGLVVAAVFAAAMSSLDSAIHSLSTCAIVDFARRYGRRERSEAAELRFARALTVAFGVLAALGATYAAQREATLLETLIQWLGYFAGPLVGLFLLAILTRRVGEGAALAGAGLAGATVAAAAYFEAPAALGMTPLWLAPWGAAVTFGVAWVVELLRLRN